MDGQAHIRRERYRGTHPKRFNEKYKELNPSRYAADVERVKERGQTPAGTHRPICLDEIMEVLQPSPGESGLDATLGYGGHSSAILAHIQPGGQLFATDVDPIELPRTESRLRALGYPPESLIVYRQNFAGIRKIVPAGGFDFILADLGVSSMQIDNPERGFTYKAPGPLDLRMNPTRGMSAASLLETLDVEELTAILQINADEQLAPDIADALCEKRGSIVTTTDFAAVIKSVLAGFHLHDPEETTRKTLQRCFQALRIAVNDEFGALEAFLRTLPWCISPGARIAILTFHSGEDRRVMDAFEKGLADGTYSSISHEAIRAGQAERYTNPRSKSARLRWAIAR